MSFRAVVRDVAVEQFMSAPAAAAAAVAAVIKLTGVTGKS
jgi:hypothetical protein